MGYLASEPISVILHVEWNSPDHTLRLPLAYQSSLNISMLFDLFRLRNGTFSEKFHGLKLKEVYNFGL